MSEENQPTPEEKRQLSLDNLNNSTITDLASAYFVEQNGNYGESVNSAIEQFKYLPALQNEENSAYIIDSLLASRQGNRRYSGNVNESQLISNAAKIMTEALGNIKTEDVLSLMNSNASLDEKYSGKYLSELDEEVQKQFIEIYRNYFVDKKVSEAISARAAFLRKNLEDIVTQSEEDSE